uniref:Uncharacterized protein n=1 Tax=Janibacter limosus TaxID=53458 RepID=A0AC61U1R5_9MICO|nr:hypothetical protein [Janibacter limosus]
MTRVGAHRARDPLTQSDLRPLGPGALGHLGVELQTSPGSQLRLEVVEESVPAHPPNLGRPLHMRPTSPVATIENP